MAGHAVYRDDKAVMALHGLLTTTLNMGEGCMTVHNGPYKVSIKDDCKTLSTSPVIHILASIQANVLCSISPKNDDELLQK